MRKTVERLVWYMSFLAEHHIIEIFILLWAAAIGVFYYFTWKISRVLHDDLSPRERKANPNERKTPETPEERRQYEDMIVSKRDHMNLLYSLFANFTSVLPLWGMLGTVISLIGLAGNMGDMAISVDRFFTALYTTALGIVFAIIYKALDSVISVKVAANNKEADTLLERNSDRKRREAKTV